LWRGLMSVDNHCNTAHGLGSNNRPVVHALPHW
jgi:hypothetical protein